MAVDAAAASINDADKPNKAYAVFCNEVNVGSVPSLQDNY